MLLVSLGALLLGVAGAVAAPPPVPNWAVPLAAALVDLLVGVLTVHNAVVVLRALSAPVAFLLCAVPMSVLLERMGLFSALARRAPVGRPGYLWALAAVVTTFLNLDTSVVLLTPLYVNIARQGDEDELRLGVQPVLLACLASSALPVSNLTNLIAASWAGTGTGAFVRHLAIPSLAATLVGWWAYRRLGRRQGRSYPGPGPAATPSRSPTGSTGASASALRAAGVVVGAVVIGFTFGDLVGIQPWMVALGAVAALVLISARSARGIPASVPWASVPAGTAVTVLSLGVLATGTAAHLSLGPMLKGGGPADLARDAALSAGAANAVNNLPALLVALEKMGHHPGPGLWGVLVGVNMGPVVLVTGSLASLLWLATMRRLGVAARARDFTRYGVAVGLPAAATGLGLALAMKAAGLW